MYECEDVMLAEHNQDRILGVIQKILNCLMLAIFIPVLFCVMFIGNKMDYFDDVKADILVPNALLTLVALAAMVICLWMIGRGRRIVLTKRANLYLNLALVVLFTGFFFFCLALSRETVFDMSVDQGIVRRAAMDVAHGVPFGYRFEFSIDYNNIPITYILGRLYRLAEGWEWFRHDPEYLWIIVGCLSVTLAGFCCCQIVKKITENVIAVLIAFALYLATAGICPWKYIPYTDSYGILFPVLCFLLYLYYRDCEHRAGKVILLFLAFLAGTIGGFIKPSGHIAVLAVLGAEGAGFLAAVIRWFRSRKPEREKRDGAGRQIRASGAFLLMGLLFFCILYGGTELCQKYIINDIGLEYNEELESTLQYYFFSSTNELTTGSFSIEDYGVFGEFQFSKADRNAACMERAWERIRQRGVIGNIYFGLKKLVKSFNDGTFAWTDVRYYEPFPEDLTHDNRIAGYLRSLFVPGGANQGKYDTLAELVWIFVLIGVPGIVLSGKKKEYNMTFTILLIGILLYLMLFESGARYVYIFLPVFIVMSACGMEAVSPLVGGKRKAKGAE